MAASKFLTATSLFYGVYSHSWLHCSDYQDPDGLNGDGTFVEGECEGYIRGWSSIWGATGFATDRGINYQSGGPNWCQSDFNADIESMYDDGFAPAEWDYGETVTLVWPAKNHANYECMSNIPDTSMKLYYNTQVNPTTEPGGTTVTDEWTLLHDWHDGCTPQSDGCGFQNCPNYCAGTDGATCFGQYTVSEADFPTAGYYTLMWYWIFNPGTPYTTCFEVYITGNGATGGGDDGDDNSGDSDSREVETFDDFIVQIPIFYTDADYDEDSILDIANNLPYDENTVISDFVVIRRSGTSTQDWNITIQTETNNGGDVSTLAYDYAPTPDYSELCTQLEEELGGSCRIDGGFIEIFGEAQSFNSSSGDSTGSAIIAVVVVLIIVLLIIAAGIFYQKMQEKKQNGSQNAAGMSNHIGAPTHTQTNIVQTS